MLPCPILFLPSSHLVLQLDVGVAVAEARDIRHLVLVEGQQLVPLRVLELHDVEDALDVGGHALVDDVLVQKIMLKLFIDHWTENIIYRLLQSTILFT